MLDCLAATVFYLKVGELVCMVELASVLTPAVTPAAMLFFGDALNWLVPPLSWFELDDVAVM